MVIIPNIDLFASSYKAYVAYQPDPEACTSPSQRLFGLSNPGSPKDSPGLESPRNTARYICNV